MEGGVIVIKGPALNADQAEKGGVRKREGTINKLMEGVRTGSSMRQE